ncbi:hypothetical protein R1flu_011157 [Riccia fluitans]|uniref:Beta-carotene isomerase D27-like C-terminal domain-containing protein n=1 Tax=Riccia fluitans TaxID=41844 RepID=A0ABD1Z770_9MARC
MLCSLARCSTLLSRVYVHKCKYLEKSKCAGICIHTCKIPTQSFIKEYMAILLAMESNIKENIKDFSCQFKYVVAQRRDEDSGLQTPCWSTYLPFRKSNVPRFPHIHRRESRRKHRLKP